MFHILIWFVLDTQQWPSCAVHQSTGLRCHPMRRDLATSHRDFLQRVYMPTIGQRMRNGRGY